MLCVAGSTRIGKRVLTSGQVGIIDHLDIADDVVLLQRAGVTNDIKTPGAYAGTPLMPLKDHMKSQAMIRRIATMRETIKELEKRIVDLESGSPHR
jgi:UDP-3-O-[3-hydroxymyristoyl] glucosamine N-acyltransferase